jgi:hypothetical protein
MLGLLAERINKERLCLISELFDRHHDINKTIKDLTDRLGPKPSAKNIQHLATLYLLILKQDLKKLTSGVELLSHPFLVTDTRARKHWQGFYLLLIIHQITWTLIYTYRLKQKITHAKQVIQELEMEKSKNSRLA